MLLSPRLRVLLPIVFGATFASASVSATHANPFPTVQLDNGTFVGTSDGIVDTFLGIPFAKPPTGDLRFRLPAPNDAYSGTYNAINFGPMCPQQNSGTEDKSVLPAETLDFLATQLKFLSGSWLLSINTPEDEDCLTINVMTPMGTKPNAGLPVAVWIYGGGFRWGGSSAYNGTAIVQRSIELEEPMIYVSLNYRLNGFGFLASKEVKEAGVGNLGLHDQREALRWLQKYIAAFGGDPQKVTIWGQSAGAHSVALQMMTNGGDTEGLFRGAFMESGSQTPFGDISLGQATYDFVVSETDCRGAADTLQCLREVPYPTLKAAIDKTPGGTSYTGYKSTWGPRVDGNFSLDLPQRLVLKGSIANVPFVTGDCDDEATMHTLAATNVTTDAELATYLSEIYFPNISQSDLAALMVYYPANVTEGSPFDTGTANAVTQQFKRLAAIGGDLEYQAARRQLLKHTVARQNAWVYLFKRFKSLPVIGSLHGTDLIDIYGGKELTDYLVHFVNHLDPNGASVPAWPRFSLDSKRMLTFLDGDRPMRIGKDDYRAEGMELLTKLLMENPF